VRAIKVTIIAPRHGGEEAGSDTTAWGILGWVATQSEVNSSGLRAYRENEDVYVRLLEGICRKFRSNHLIIANPVVFRPLPANLGDFRNGSTVSISLAGRLIRSMLRGNGGTACAFLVPGVNLRLAVGPRDSLLIEAGDELISVIAAMLPPGLAIVGEYELDADEYISAPVNDEFWDKVIQDGVDRKRPVWIQETWAQGKYGQRWFLADSSTIQDVKAVVYNNSAISAGAVDMPVEVIRLDEVFDEVSAGSADELEMDLYVIPNFPGSGPRLDALPLDSQLLRSGSISLSEPVRVIYTKKFNVAGYLEPGERLWEGVVPDQRGRLWARWLGLTIPET
jgi:hypothetical protein